MDAGAVVTRPLPLPLPLPGAIDDPAYGDADARADRSTRAPTPIPISPASSDAWMLEDEEGGEGLASARVAAPPPGCSDVATGSNSSSSSSSAAVAARPVSGSGSGSSRPPTAPFFPHRQARSGSVGQSRRMPVPLARPQMSTGSASASADAATAGYTPAASAMDPDGSASEGCLSEA